jgi:hypothetical protein
MRQDPGEFMVQRLEASLPESVASRIPRPVEVAAARSMAVGYGLAAGAAYGLLRTDGRNVVADGVVLGIVTWAAGYAGWLPALGLTPRLREQSAPQALGPLVLHIVFGAVTAVAYRWLAEDPTIFR